MLIHVEPSEHVAATVERVAAAGRPDLEQAEALVDVALDLQKQPRAPQDLFDALYLYEKAVTLAEEFPAARARAIAGRGSALRRMPGGGLEALEGARSSFEEALPVLREVGEPEEVAEIEMSLGLVLQALANDHKASLGSAVAAYQRALKVFSRGRFPREFAILHNNLATAYLSMRLSPEQGKMREALAVQSFREALKVVTLEEDPTEYAMLQNNLGNALQAVQTSHRFENLHRAVEAYDEALKVRTEYDTPVEYANTLANKANALMNLPDVPGEEEKGNPKNTRQAIELLRKARAVFSEHHLPDRAQMVGELVDGLTRELLAHGGDEHPSNGNGAEG
ncbi:MAG: hypothetical protein AAGF12_09470 [Myxococcota bacterium]